MGIAEISHDDERERIIEEIDELTAPAKMTKEEALEWLEELYDQLDTRISALREEIA